MGEASSRCCRTGDSVSSKSEQLESAEKRQDFVEEAAEFGQNNGRPSTTKSPERGRFIEANSDWATADREGASRRGQIGRDSASLGPPPGMPSGNDFSVLLKKGVETKLGMAVSNYETPGGAWLCIQEINEGLVASWNSTNPGKDVKHGDLIWGVNGVGSTARNIVNECMESEALELKIRRPVDPQPAL